MCTCAFECTCLYTHDNQPGEGARYHPLLLSILFLCGMMSLNLELAFFSQTVSKQAPEILLSLVPIGLALQVVMSPKSACYVGKRIKSGPHQAQPALHQAGIFNSPIYQLAEHRHKPHFFISSFYSYKLQVAINVITGSVICTAVNEKSFLLMSSQKQKTSNFQVINSIVQTCYVFSLSLITRDQRSKQKSNVDFFFSFLFHKYWTYLF